MRVAKYRRANEPCDEQIAVFVGVAESTCSTPSLLAARAGPHQVEGRVHFVGEQLKAARESVRKLMRASARSADA